MNFVTRDVNDPSGRTECSSTTASGNFIESPGRLTRPDEDYYDPRSCVLVKNDNDQRIEDCLRQVWEEPRPRYGLDGVNNAVQCQDYSRSTLGTRQARCR